MEPLFCAHPSDNNYVPFAINQTVHHIQQCLYKHISEYYLKEYRKRHSVSKRLSFLTGSNCSIEILTPSPHEKAIQQRIDYLLKLPVKVPLFPEFAAYDIRIKVSFYHTLFIWIVRESELYSEFSSMPVATTWIRRHHDLSKSSSTSWPQRTLLYDQHMHTSIQNTA